MSIPIHIVAGYLGAGKTTYINRWLARSPDLRGTLILVNDFGTLDIDAALLQTAGDQNLVTLSNGCVCCSIQDDFAGSLQRILELKQIHRVILEASGVGLPGRLRAQCSYPGFAPGIIQVIVDAVNHDVRLKDKYVADLVARQVREADQLLVSKLELNPSFTLIAEAPVADATTCAPGDGVARQSVASDEQSMTAPPVSFRTLSFLPPKVDIDTLQGAFATPPNAVARMKGVVGTTGGNCLVQWDSAVLKIERTPLPVTGVVLIGHRDAFSKVEQYADDVKQTLGNPIS